MTLSTTVKVKAPTTLKYAWTFSDGDKSRVRTYKVGGKGLKTVRLSTSIKVAGDARGWGAVRLAGPVKKTSGKAWFAVTCAGDDRLAGDVWDSVGTFAGEADRPSGSATPSPSPSPSGSASPSPSGSASPSPTGQNPLRKAVIALERTTTSKCPVTFKVHGYFEGLPAGAQTVRYRLVGTQEWKTVNVPADHGAVFSTVLETIDWDWEAYKPSAQIEIDQPNGLKSNVVYYFKCGPLPSGTKIGDAAEAIARTGMGGPLAELVADAHLEAVQAVSGAQVALASKNKFHIDLKAGPITSQDLAGVQPSGFSIDVRTMTGAQLKTLLEHANPKIGVLTPSASLRYTLTGGVVTELTLNGAPVADAQVLRVAATHGLMGGQEGFPHWRGTSRVYGGLDDKAALASYIANHSPVRAPKGDRVTLR
ncbi:5'-nucleotidase C-terminal domain-containing protein [Planomonospora algeriensis]